MHRTKGFLFAGLAASVAATALITPVAARAADATFDRRMAFDISATDLRGGISAFSRATGVQVLVTPAAVQGRRTAGVSGTHSVREALAVMLQGTGLTASIHGSVAMLKPGAAPARTALIRSAKAQEVASAAPAPAAAPGADDAQADDVIIVSGYRAEPAGRPGTEAPRGGNGGRYPGAGYRRPFPT